MQFSKVLSVIFTAFVATAAAQNDTDSACTSGEYSCDNTDTPSQVLVCNDGAWAVINTCADEWTCVKDASGGCTCQEA